VKETCVSLKLRAKHRLQSSYAITRSLESIRYFLESLVRLVFSAERCAEILVLCSSKDIELCFDTSQNSLDFHRHLIGVRSVVVHSIARSSESIEPIGR
jgi:hypothetical protein